MVVSHLVSRLTEGLDTHTRKDGKVIRLHAGDRTIGEIVIGDETLRVNVKELLDEADLVAQAEGLDFNGRSKAWYGGIRITDANVGAVKEVISTIAESAREERQRTRSLTEAVATIEQARRTGTLDSEFEAELRKLLGRRTQRGGVSRRRTRTRA